MPARQAISSLNINLKGKAVRAWEGLVGSVGKFCHRVPSFVRGDSVGPCGNAAAKQTHRQTSQPTCIEAIHKSSECFHVQLLARGPPRRRKCSPSQYKHVFVDESLALGKSHSRSPTIKSISPLQSSPVLYFRYVPVQSTEYSIFGAPQGDHQISSLGRRCMGFWLCSCG